MAAATGRYGRESTNGGITGRDGSPSRPTHFWNSTDAPEVRPYLFEVPSSFGFSAFQMGPLLATTGASFPE
jgi:hypothetical protein